MSIWIVWSKYWVDKTCNIYSQQFDPNSSSATPIYTEVYTAIRCDYWKQSRSETMKRTDISDTTDVERWNVVLEPQYVGIQKRMKIELISSSWRNDWGFIIESIEEYPSSSWKQNLIYLTVLPIW